MLTRRRLVKVGAASAVGAGLVPQWLYPDRANAADLRDPNNPGFDLRGVNARYLAQGAPFSPYLLKFAMVNNLTNLWDSNRESQQASFWKVRGHSVGNKKFLPLGDAVSVNGTGPQSVAALLVAPDDQHPDVLRHPIGWQFIIDDHGSHNSRDLRYHQPIPPDGYTALGVCWNSTDADLGNYWCVRDDQVYTLSGRSRVWSDENSHIVHDGSLYRGAFGAEHVAAANRADRGGFVDPACRADHEHARSGEREMDPPGSPSLRPGQP